MSTRAILICFAIVKSVLCSSQELEGWDCRKYLIVTDQKYNWYQATHECARRNMELVSIASEDKNSVIIELLKKNFDHFQNLWLGGNDEHSTSREFDRPFYWSGSGQQVNFTYWSDDNPNNERAEEHCMHIWDFEPEYKWNDIECTARMGFICEPNHQLETCQKNFDDEYISSNHLDVEVQLRSDSRDQKEMNRTVEVNELTNLNQNTSAEVIYEVNLELECKK